LKYYLWTNFNKNYLEYILKITNGKIDGKGGCAELLQVNANTLRAKIKKLGLNIKKTSSRNNLCNITN
jgi:DNA-binding NtrC family response regulator